MFQLVPYPQFVFYAVSAVAVVGLSIAFIMELVGESHTGRERLEGLFDDRPAKNWRRMGVEKEAMED
jgi:hypothetical protein